MRVKKERGREQYEKKGVTDREVRGRSEKRWREER